MTNLFLFHSTGQTASLRYCSSTFLFVSVLIPFGFPSNTFFYLKINSVSLHANLLFISLLWRISLQTVWESFYRCQLEHQANVDYINFISCRWACFLNKKIKKNETCPIMKFKFDWSFQFAAFIKTPFFQHKFDVHILEQYSLLCNENFSIDSTTECEVFNAMYFSVGITQIQAFFLT